MCYNLTLVIQGFAMVCHSLQAIYHVMPPSHLEFQFACTSWRMRLSFPKSQFPTVPKWFSYSRRGECFFRINRRNNSSSKTQGLQTAFVLTTTFTNVNENHLPSVAKATGHYILLQQHTAYTAFVLSTVRFWHKLSSKRIWYHQLNL